MWAKRRGTTGRRENEGHHAPLDKARRRGEAVEVGSLVARHQGGLRFSIDQRGTVHIFGSSGTMISYLPQPGRRLAAVDAETLRIVSLGPLEAVPPAVADLVAVAGDRGGRSLGSWRWAVGRAF